MIRIRITFPEHVPEEQRASLLNEVLVCEWRAEAAGSYLAVVARPSMLERTLATLEHESRAGRLLHELLDEEVS